MVSPTMAERLEFCDLGNKNHANSVGMWCEAWAQRHGATGFRPVAGLARRGSQRKAPDNMKRKRTDQPVGAASRRELLARNSTQPSKPGPTGGELAAGRRSHDQW